MAPPDRGGAAPNIAVRQTRSTSRDAERAPIVILIDDSPIDKKTAPDPDPDQPLEGQTATPAPPLELESPAQALAFIDPLSTDMQDDDHLTSEEEVEADQAPNELTLAGNLSATFAAATQPTAEPNQCGNLDRLRFRRIPI